MIIRTNDYGYIVYVCRDIHWCCFFAQMPVCHRYTQKHIIHIVIYVLIDWSQYLICKVSCIFYSNFILPYCSCSLLPFLLLDHFNIFVMLTAWNTFFCAHKHACMCLCIDIDLYFWFSEFSILPWCFSLLYFDMLIVVHCSMVTDFLFKFIIVAELDKIYRRQ